MIKIVMNFSLYKTVKLMIFLYGLYVFILFVNNVKTLPNRCKEILQHGIDKISNKIKLLNNIPKQLTLKSYKYIDNIYKINQILVQEIITLSIKKILLDKINININKRINSNKNFLPIVSNIFQYDEELKKQIQNVYNTYFTNEYIKKDTISLQNIIKKKKNILRSKIFEINELPNHLISNQEKNKINNITSQIMIDINNNNNNISYFNNLTFKCINFITDSLINLVVGKQKKVDTRLMHNIIHSNANHLRINL